MIGSQIGSYRIEKLLGEGGMGTVYLATDNIQRQVAVKALRPQLTHDENRLDRFRSEAVALGRLHHPNIASLFHLLEENDNLYMVMEFVDGQTLDDLISQNGALPPRLALDILVDGLQGFEHAHSRGVIHRDIKASNLMVSAEGTTKIMDFGIARMDGAARLTQAGRQIGTLEYMSPEQVQGGEQDARSDIYSLGILLFELLTGRVPFTDASDFELMRAHLEKAPASIRHFVPSLPAALDDVIAKALAKDPNDRFQNVTELRSALEAIALDLPVTAALSTPPPVTIPTRSTSLGTPKARHTLIEAEPEDRYATRLQGSGLPTPPAPPVVPVAPPVAVQPPPAPAVTAPPKRFPTLAAVGGVVLVLIGILAWAMMRSTPQSAAPNRKQPNAVVKKAPRKRSAVAAQKPKPQVRRAAPRRRIVERTRPRRAPREVASKRPVAKRPIARPAQRAATSSSEKAALRALIKNN
ncbi:serine/threonine protein kinase [bacterium]|nr:MAG: serine/threonine protein kinase [bacterium]